MADRYTPQLQEARPTTDNKIAFFENQQLAEGNPVPVVTNEIHGVHLQIHIPALTGLIEQLNTGAADPVQALPVLQAFYQHVAETVEHLATDPMQQALVGEAKQVLQYAEEMINNTSKKVQKMQRDAAQQAPAEGEGQPQGDPNAEANAQAKMAEHQMKMQMAQQKAQLDMELRQAKFDQEQAMQDAKNAMELRQIQ